MRFPVPVVSVLLSALLRNSVVPDFASVPCENILIDCGHSNSLLLTRLLVNSSGVIPIPVSMTLSNSVLAYMGGANVTHQ